MSSPRMALVTGATGFIGQELVRVLIAEGWVVTAGMRADSRVALPVEISGRVDYDLAATDPITLPPGLDTVFHLAGKAHALAEVAQDDSEYTGINTDGTRRLLEAAQRAGVRAFVYFSSVKAMGEAPPEGAAAIDEDYPVAPDTPYGRSKRAAEALVLRGGYVEHPVVVRPSLVYGARAKGNLEKMVAAVATGRFPPVPELGNRRSMVHLRDVCVAAIAVALHPAAIGRTYILTDGVPVSTRQLFVWMCEALGRSVPGWTVPLWALRLLGRIGDVVGRIRQRRFVFDSDALAKLTGSAWYSSARLEREIGWVPRYDLRSSLPEIVGAVRGGETEGLS